MRKEDIQELKLMETVAEDGGVATQRELASRLNISLGLVNTFIKRLVRKGYFKITTIPGRRVRYLLTPTGLAQKARLTRDYLQFSLSYYREMRTKFLELADALCKQQVRKVALVGTEELAELFYLAMQEVGIEMSQVLSNNGSGKKFMGHHVQPLSALRHEAFDMVCVADLDDIDRTLGTLKTLGIPKERVVVVSNFEDRR